MRGLFNKTRISQPPQFVEAASLYEHQSLVKWDSKHHESPFTHHEFDFETTLFVVFDGETRHRFSSARIVLYYDKAECIKDPPCIRGLGSANNLGGRVRHALPNDCTLPQLTVAFKVVPSPGITKFVLVLQSSDDELRNRRHNSAHVLLESEFAMTPDTVSLSVAFEHPPTLRTLRREPSYCRIHQSVMCSKEYGIVRIVRVVPGDVTRPRTTTCRLPMELLMKIFEAIDSYKWQHELLSFAQVCRRWSCSLRVLFARLECPEKENHRCCMPRLSNRFPDPYAFAKAFTETPVLGLDIRRLVLDEHVGLCCNYVSGSLSRRIQTGFTPALVAVLRATKDLQRLHISQAYSSRANTIFSALPELSDLRTLTVTQSHCHLYPHRHHNTISTLQLARCMARWPALTSLWVERLSTRSLGMRRFFLRPPACALTHLHIYNSYISDANLLYLTASSANTLVQVALEYVKGITPAGLHAFLDSISQQVTSLKVVLWDGCPSATDTTEQGLDTLVDKMPCLEVLSIGGRVRVASECMLRRRSEMFARSCSSGDAAVPVVRLSIERWVPGLEGWIRDKGWPGWQMVEWKYG